MKFPVLLCVCLCGGAAAAAELPCGQAEAGAVTIDGITDDWRDVDGLDGGGHDPNASFTMKCNVDERALYLLVDVRDDYFVHTAQPRPGEDHLELSLGGRKLVVYPGVARAKDRVTWGGKPAKAVRTASALQEHGWAVELAVPLGELPGWKRGTPSVPFDAVLADCDSKASLKTDRTVALDGRIAFSESDAALQAFLDDRKLGRESVYWDKPLATGKKSGARVVLAGRFLAVLADGFLYLELPFRDRRDLREARLVDLAGDGRDAIVLRYLERGGGGARELLAIYRPVGDSQIERVFAAEVGKSAGAARIEDKVSFVRRGRATDVVIEAGTASGVTQASWNEAPADDAIPILLPWGDERRARYQFAGDEYKRAP